MYGFHQSRTFSVWLSLNSMSLFVLVISTVVLWSLYLDRSLQCTQFTLVVCSQAYRHNADEKHVVGIWPESCLMALTWQLTSLTVKRYS